MSKHGTTCTVCGTAVSIQGHHLIMQADHGTEGPMTPLCATHHQLAHDVASRYKHGDSGDALMRELTEDQRERLLTVVQVILIGSRANTTGNPHPLLSCSLDTPIYMRALDMWKADHGFTSRNAALNAIMRTLAIGYGLMEDAPQNGEKTGKRASLSQFRGAGPG